MPGTIYLGLDAHKDSVTIAVLPEGMDKPKRVVKLPHEPALLRKFFDSLVEHEETVLRACYESSSVGFTLQRHITSWGYHCDVVASSLIPTVGGARRRKFDRSDAAALARYYAKGELTVVRTPSVEEEDEREMVRCRTTVQTELGRVRHFILKLCTRHGLRYTEGNHWTQKHWRWLRTIRRELSPGVGRTFDEYVALYEYVEQRRDALDREIEALASTERYASHVERLRCYRGIDRLSAMILLTELGTDWRRFPTAGSAMAFVGLVPSEASSGERERRGSITKAGNSRCRHVLVQAAWSARYHPRMSQLMRARRSDQPASVVAHAQQAQEHLHRHYRRIRDRRGPQVAVVATARELMGFLWAAMQAPELHGEKATTTTTTAAAAA